jgi:DNA-binding PucR family transcriptional regulator
VLRPLAADIRARAPELSEATVAQIRERLPDLFPDPASAEENRRSIEGTISGLADLIEQGADPAEIELPAATMAYARAGAQRGVPFPVLLRSYRLGHEAVWNVLFAELVSRSRDADELARAVELCSAWVFGYVDAAVTLGEEFYAVERERWLRSTAASRDEAIDAILAGRERDPLEASQRLRYELERHHVGAIAWLEAAPENANPLASLEAAVSGLAHSLGAGRTLVRPVGLLAVSAWVSSPAPLEPDVLDRAEFDARAAPGVRVAIGEPGAGLTGFRRSHGEAEQARRVATLGRRRAGSVTRYGRIALSALATSDLEQARVFVERELGELANDDDVSLRLAATLRAYLDEQTSRGRTAKRLGIHENTVSYRVRQAEEILGRSVDNRTLELRVALALVQIVTPGPDVGVAQDGGAELA